MAPLAVGQRAVLGVGAPDRLGHRGQEQAALVVALPRPGRQYQHAATQ
jgi:hypothetical protein